MDDNPRTVRPRTRKYARLPVTVIASDHAWLSEDGETGDFLDFLLRLPDLPPTIFVKQNIADFASALDPHFAHSHPAHWQFKLTTHERSIVRPSDGMKIAARVNTVVHTVGFKGHKYHKMIDPETMYGHGIDTIWPGDEPIDMRLFAWAKELRDFCHANGMEVRPTIGGISGQYWTDRRFYPNARRKVPHRINARARDELPGNHYALSVHPSPKRYFTAWYLDQHRAHHYHALHSKLPDADSLYALGYFHNLDGIAFPAIEPDFMGLYCLDLDVPPIDPMLNWLRPHHGTPYYFVFTNELQFLLDLGVKVKGVVAAWGSHIADNGVNRYASYASQQLDRYEDAPWLKPLLLAAYGTLATRASWGETIFKLANRGEPVSIYTGRRKLDGLLVRAPHRLEPKFVNVLHRGMIEASCRADSLGLAHWLDYTDQRVLSIYADAVIVEADEDKPLPHPLPEPWRIKRRLNHLQFVSQQAFISGEMTKLPGVSRELKEYARCSTGYAPRRKLWDVLTGRPIKTNRRI